MRDKETLADRFITRLAAFYAASALAVTLIITPAVAVPVQAAERATESVAEEWTSLGTFKLTYYCPCRRCNGKNAGKTASGAVPTQGRTIAVDRRVIPLGTEVMIDGYVYRAEDTGVRGQHIDIFRDSHAECLQLGVKQREVFIRKK